MSKTIAIFRTGGIGDVILSTVSIQIIYRVYPHAKIVWFGREPTLTLIKSVFKNIDVYEISSNRTYFENLKIVLNSVPKIDTIIDLQHSARTLILGKIASLILGCQYTTWNKYSIERSLLVIQSFIRSRTFHFDWLKNELPNRYDAMAKCTYKALNKISSTPIVYQVEIPTFLNLISEKKSETVSICLGAKFLSKALPIDKIKTIIEIIISKTVVRTFHLIGDENQRKNADSIMAHFEKKAHFLNHCGLTTLTEAAKLLSSSKYSITNDSGLSHLSETVNTPVITFFGPTHPKFGYRPFLKNSLILSVDIGCRPCNKNGDVKCRFGDHACSKQIDFQQMEKLILNINHD